MAVHLDPIEGVLAVLDEGSATGTNKFGLLLALIDLAPTIVLDETDGALDVREIAAKLIELQWDHARHFDGGVLRQVTSGNKENTTVVLEVQKLHGHLHARGVAPPSFEAARALLDAAEWDRAVGVVAAATSKNPLRYLQTINRQDVTFLYEPVNARGVCFVPGAVAALVRFGPVLRDLVEFRYVRFVVAANQVSLGPSIEEQVAEHLFGLERHMPPMGMRQELWELQNRCCLYTGNLVDSPVLGTGNSSLDHVVPWYRARVSVIENLVLTTRSVNSAKSKLLLAPPLVEQWSAHVRHHAGELRNIASRYGWPADVSRVARVAAGIYRQASPASSVWQATDTVAALGEVGKAEVVSRFDELATAI